MKELLGIALLATALAVAPALAAQPSVHKAGYTTAKTKSKKHSGKKQHASALTTKPAGQADTMKPMN